MRLLIVCIGFFCISDPAQAYIGPGLGVGVLAGFLSVLAGIGLLVVGVIYYPIKKLILMFRRPAKSRPDSLPADEV